MRWRGKKTGIWESIISKLVTQVRLKWPHNSNILTKVQRIQSKSLFEAYSIHRKRLKNKNFNENELKLWHGTKNESVESISKQGFNRSFCGINGILFRLLVLKQV